MKIKRKKNAATLEPVEPAAQPLAATAKPDPRIAGATAALRIAARDAGDAWNPSKCRRNKLPPPEECGFSAAGIDPRLARARARGRAVRDKMKLAEGGSLTAVEVAARLGLSETTVLERYTRGQLLAWREGRARIHRFPSWQFQADHVIAGLAEVLEVLNREKLLDDFGRIGFFLCTFGLLDGLRPLDCLRTNHKDKALLAAESYVE